MQLKRKRLVKLIDINVPYQAKRKLDLSTIILSLLAAGMFQCGFIPTDVFANPTSKAIVDLHRLDFRLEGKSCATCLLSIQRKLNSLPGVKNAVVMLKRPYGVSIVYEVHEIKAQEILTLLKDKEPNLKILETNDSAIKAAPPFLIPPFVPQLESQL